MDVSWPDLGAPPQGWTVVRQGAALHLHPPGTRRDKPPEATIVVSPLVPVSAAMPGPGVVIRQALSAEVASLGIEVLEEGQPAEVCGADGLAGVRIDVTVRTRAGDQRRAYTMFKDSDWLYGIHLIARPDAWAANLATYESAAGSVKPYRPT